MPHELYAARGLIIGRASRVVCSEGADEQTRNEAHHHEAKLLVAKAREQRSHDPHIVVDEEQSVDQ